MKLRSQVSRLRFQSGVTLIELLLALVIGSLIIALVFSVFRTTSSAVQGQKNREQGAPAAARALDLIRADLSSSFFPAEDAACALTLSSTNGAAALAFCRIQSADGGDDPRWSSVLHVEYRLERGTQLVRVATAAAGPGSLDGTATNILVADLDAFRVTVFDGAEWSDVWPGKNAKAQPRAARVEIASARFKGKASWESEVMIPAGLVVTSSIVRTTAPTP